MARSTLTTTGAPLAQALPELIRERGLTQRALATRTRELEPERGVTHGHIANLISGRDHPTIRVLELLAAALKVTPEHFAEYRLAALRRELDERTVGIEAAWRRYEQLIS